MDVLTKEEIMTDDVKSGDEGPQEELLTIDEAAAFLGTSKSTLYRLMGQGDVKGAKVGKQWRFLKGDLRAYLQRGSVAVAIDGAARADMDILLAEMGATVSFDTDEEKIDHIAGVIIKEAILSGASDIHLEPMQGELWIRYRIDGVLHRIHTIPKPVQEAVITRFKTMAEMEVMEKRLPQDGRIPVKFEDKDYDLRANCVPTFYGESIVVRILDRSSVHLGLSNLGFSPASHAALKRMIEAPNGIVITTGPTGSGKTTLLYSCLRTLANESIKTITIEDPIEYLLPGVMQVAVNKRAGLTFANGLRSFLRQDPDVLMVGENRDLETVQTSIEAALTGHMVLTTLHTDDAPGALLRLADMGIEPYLVAATVIGVVAVRLARRLCPNCKTILDPQETASMLNKVRKLAAAGGYDIPSTPILYEAVGCSECRNTGYRGRIGLQEVLSCNSKFVTQLLDCASLEEMTRLAVSTGMQTLLADGVSKAVAGETTIDEVIRVAAPAV